MLKSPSLLSAIHKLRELLSREEKWKCVGIAGFALCTSVFEIITASSIVLLAQVLTNPESGYTYFEKIAWRGDLSTTKVILYCTIGCGIAYLIKSLVAAAEIFFQNFSIQEISYCFKKRLLNQYARMDYGTYLTRNSAFGLSVISGDAEVIFSTGMLALAITLSEAIIFLSLTGLIIYMNPSLALLIFTLSSTIGLIIVKTVLPLFYRWGLKLQDATLHSGKSLLQFFHAFKEVVLMKKKDAFIDSFNVHSLKRNKTLAVQTSVNNIPRILIELLFIGLFVISIVYLCLEHETPQEMIAIMSSYLYAGFRLMPGLNRVINQLNTFKSTIPSINRVYEEYQNLAATDSCGNSPGLTFKQSIVINQVSFRYLNTKTNALTEVNTTLEKGECIGVIGETGSGKSTFVDLILGLLKPTEGNLLIDGHFPVNSQQWHQKIGYVPQSIYLIDESIAANIAFGETPEEINSAKLETAIKDAQLENFIKKLKNGYDTIVGERGMRLSGGERQRIAIARALYRNPEVLIFDEATSALDNDTEKKLMRTIYSVRKNRTLIMIAHRLSTLEKCDRILVFDNGSLKKVTDYKELQGKKEVRYA